MSLRRIKDHNEMERLFKEHYALLCLVAYGILKDRDTAKDVVQDFFISYWERRKKTRITVSFKSYAIGAVKNLSLISLKKASKEKVLIQNMPIENYNEPHIDLETNTSKIHDLLNQLPESRRKIFVSAILNGQSYSEIAETQGISINTVKTQMKRAYAFLRSEATESILRILMWSTFVYLA